MTSTSSPTQSFTVNPASESTTTSLNAVTSPITYGSETAETFSGTVTGQSGDGYPEGTVTLYYGTTPVSLCSETLPSGSGDSAGFSCSLTSSQLAVGTYSSVDAVFSPGGTSSSNPDYTYTTSTSTPTQSFTVDQSTALSTSLSTLLSGGGQSGSSISVLAGTAVTDSATLSGTNASSAGGTITYNVYTDAGCTTLAQGGGGTALNITTAGTLPASAAVTLSTPGTYYWQASYSGDVNNAASLSTCGAETETVTSSNPTTTTTTCQTGQTCSGTVTIPGSVAVSVTGTSSTTGSLTVSLGTNTISCGDPFRHAPSMTTVSVSGLTINGTKTAVITINKSVVFAKGAPWWIPYAVCFSSPTPFRSITGRMTTLGLLPFCSTRFNGPPCVVSILPDRSGDVIETLQLPASDPRFH